MDRPTSATFQAVEDWLRSLGLLHYAQQFYDNGYEDIDTVKEIGEKDLDAIGIRSDRDRKDILNGVQSLLRNIYFELETGEEPVQREKLEPVVLKKRLKQCLEENNVQLTEPPYFNPDGTLGDLYPLAIHFSDELHTFFEDVLEALINLRKRQLPIQTYDEMAEEGHDGPEAKARSLTTVNPAEYLDCEAPGKTRSYSFSKYDTRVTKSTTDLTKDFVNKGSKEEPTKTRSDNKSKKIFSSVFRKRGDLGKSVKGDRRSIDPAFNAGDVKMTEDEIKDIFKNVKNNRLTKEDALAAVIKACNEKKSSPQSSPDVTRKFGKDGSLGRNKKGKIEKSMIKRTSSSSQFYTKEDRKDEDTRSLNEYRTERSGSLFENELSPSSTKSSPDTQKHGFLKGIRNSLRKKARNDEEKLHEKSPSGSTSSHENIRLTESAGEADLRQYELQKKRSPSTQSADARINQSKSSSSSESNVKQEIEDNLKRQASLKVKPTSYKNENNLSKESKLEKPDLPKPPPRSGKNLKPGEVAIVTPKPVLPLKPQKPNVPQRKDLTVSPIEEKNIDQIGLEVNQIIAGLNNDLEKINSPVASNKFPKPNSASGKVPLMPPKRVLQPPPKPKSTEEADNLINDLKNAAVAMNKAENTNLDKNMNIKTQTVVPKKPATRKLKFKPLSLREILLKKLQHDRIEIHRPPYTQKDGVWNVPIALVSRYANELHLTNSQIEDMLEEIRLQKCETNNLTYVASNVHRSSNEVYVGSLDKLTDWLFHIGLPMFFDDLSDVNINTVHDISKLTPSDFLYIGIYDEKHVKQLLDQAVQYSKTVLI